MIQKDAYSFNLVESKSFLPGGLQATQLGPKSMPVKGSPTPTIKYNKANADALEVSPASIYYLVISDRGLKTLQAPVSQLGNNAYDLFIALKSDFVSRPLPLAWRCCAQGREEGYINCFFRVH